jgi:uncharacterized protein (TIGR03437 family)
VRRVPFLFLSTAFGLIAQVILPPVPGAPATLQIVSGNNQNAVVNTEFAQPMTVRVLDANGVAVPGVVVTFTFPTPYPDLATAGFAPLNVSSQSFTTSATGFVTTPIFAANMLAGAYNVRASFARQSGGTVSQNLSMLNMGVPAAAVFPTSLAFQMVIGDPAPPTQTVSVNSPTGGYDASSDSPWLKFFARTNTLLDVSVDPTGLAVGRYFGYIFISNNMAIPVRLTILPKPRLTATVPRINFAYTQGATTIPLIQPFWVSAMMNPLNLEVAVKYNNPATGNWLAVASPKGMTTPAQLKAVCDPRGLTAGTYTAEIDITSASASNSPLVIPVTLVVAKYPFTGPEVTLISNAASAEPGVIAAGELVRVAGGKLSCDRTPSLLMDGEPADIVSSGGDEIRAIVPKSVAGKGRVDVRYGCGSDLSDAFSMPVSYAAPGLFTSDSQAMVFNEDGTLNSDAAAAPRDSVITLYGTGIGDGSLAPISVNIGGEAATLVSVEPVPDMPGVTRLKMRVPRFSGIGSQPVELLAGTETAQSTVVVQ